MIPESTSTASDAESSQRSTSPTARTICSVSRMCATVIATVVQAAIVSHDERVRPCAPSSAHESEMRAQARNATSEVGAKPMTESSSRRSTSTDTPRTTRPVSTVASVVGPATRSIAVARNAAAIAVRA
jgi:hypothetical protein